MYKIELTKTARKTYLKLPEHIRQSIYTKMNELAKNPYAPHHDVKYLKTLSGYFRLRVGNWRVIYRLDNEILIIEVIKIGHRREVYQ